MNTLSERIPIKPLPASLNLRTGLGLQFAAFPGYWSLSELTANAQAGAVNTPCARWDAARNNWTFYINGANT
jgi:hypothetical protein